MALNIYDFNKADGMMDDKLDDHCNKAGTVVNSGAT